MRVQLEQDINAPADAAWHVLGSQFADIANWATFVRSSRALRAEEVPNSITPDLDAPVPGRETTTLATLREVIIDYSDTRRALTFAAIGLPRIVRRMTRTFPGVLGDLKVHVESGTAER